MKNRRLLIAGLSLLPAVVVLCAAALRSDPEIDRRLWQGALAVALLGSLFVSLSRRRKGR